ncbi:MAG: potassium transporter Kup [Acidobacteriota bacterium]
MGKAGAGGTGREDQSPQSGRPAGRRLALLTLGALGIVYGDIGTSPLYALRQCFAYLPPTAGNVLGVLSLIFWSLIVVISLKYMLFVMRAENDGEGGILALMALAVGRDSGKRPLLVALGLFGASLLYGDGMITPAISVLGAVEGLQVATPLFAPWVIPLSVLILFSLFLFQRRGTARVAAVFGPLMVVWFTCIAGLGIVQILRQPSVLKAFSPLYSFQFFGHHRGVAFIVLGAVFLVVTGGEALYADMGHFGRRPIQLAWFAMVLPALVVNYFGQGALLLRESAAVRNPFYLLAPEWALYPLVLLATLATVIASQAVISGAFSLAHQSVGLGYSPRLKIVHTSEEQRGQIYVPAVNWTLMIAVIALVLGFRSSGNLAAAYGVAVTTTMIITTLLAFVVALERWNWPLLAAALVALSFLVIDLSFFGANIFKIAEGGWLPLLIAALAYTLMSTWKQGRKVLAARLKRQAVPIARGIPHLLKGSQRRVRGTAVYMIGNPDATPPALLHGVKHYKVLHQRVVLLTITVENVPRVPARRRVEITDLGHGFFRVEARFGFMQSPRIPNVLSHCGRQGLEFDTKETTFFLGREVLIARSGSRMAHWRRRLFDRMSRNARKATDSFGLPRDRVVEIGAQVQL